MHRFAQTGGPTAQQGQNDQQIFNLQSSSPYRGNHNAETPLE